jgi:hypothetical protein
MEGLGGSLSAGLFWPRGNTRAAEDRPFICLAFCLGLDIEAGESARCLTFNGRRVSPHCASGTLEVGKLLGALGMLNSRHRRV